jgi:hypothetical protein
MNRLSPSQWQKIQNEYVFGHEITNEKRFYPSIRELAERLDIHEDNLESRSRRQSWMQKRKEQQPKPAEPDPEKLQEYAKNSFMATFNILVALKNAIVEQLIIKELDEAGNVARTLHNPNLSSADHLRFANMLIVLLTTLEDTSRKLASMQTDIFSDLLRIVQRQFPNLGELALVEVEKANFTQAE